MIKIKEEILVQAAQESMDAFFEAVVEAIYSAIGGRLTAETMAELNADQITLLAYKMLRDELMEGGFVQLIHNGYGPFIFKNPFAKALKEWGVTELGKLVQKAYKQYGKYRDMIEREMTDEEFMALFEKCPEFDDLDDEFVISEERFTTMVAYYVDDNLGNFVEVEK